MKKKIITMEDILDILPIARERVNWYFKTESSLYNMDKPRICPLCALVQELDPDYFRCNTALIPALDWFKLQNYDIDPELYHQITRAADYYKGPYYKPLVNALR